jgi:hypothetical protein
MAQPTEQWVQTLVTFWISPMAAGDWALACLTFPSLKPATAATPPAVKPEVFKNVRLSTARPATPVSAFDKRGPFATPLVFFVSIDSS